MIRDASFFSGKQMTPFLIVAILFSSYALKGGDVKFFNVEIAPFAVVEEPYQIDIDFRNDEAFDVDNFKVNYSIFKLSPSLTWEITYEYETPEMTFPKNSGMTIGNGDNPWIPSTQGRYELRIKTSASNDINPDNDDMTIDLTANRFLKLRFKQYDLIQPPLGSDSDWGAVSLKFGMKNDLSFFNIKARNPVTQDESWIVKNAEVPPLTMEYTRFYYRFNYSDLGFQAGSPIEKIEWIAEESDQPVQNFELNYGWMESDMRKRTFNLGLRYDHLEGTNPSLPTEMSMPEFSMPGGFTYFSRINELEGENLDNVNHPPSEGYEGDFGNSGPLSLSIGMNWLDIVSEEFDRAQEETVRQTMEQFRGLMELVDGQFITTQNVIQAKLEYIDMYQLPIRVDYQSWWSEEDFINSPVSDYSHRAENGQAGMTDVAPQWSFIYQAIQDGCAVELQIGWYNLDGTRLGGFWAPVAGASQSDGTRSLTLREDINEADSSRSIENVFHFFQEDGGWGRLTGYDGPGWMAYVESALVQCYDPGVTFESSGLNDVAREDHHDLFLNNPGRSGRQLQIIFEWQPSAGSRINVSMFNLQGQLVANEIIHDPMPGRNLHTLPARFSERGGSYLLILESETGTSVRKLVLY